MNRPKLCGNCSFPQNFHTTKLGEITVFFAVCITRRILNNCFPNKDANSEITSCRVNVIKGAPDRKDGGRRKETTPSTFSLNENR